MSGARLPAGTAEALRRAFGSRLREAVPLARYTSARLGGPADFLVTVRSADALAETATWLWEHRMAFRFLGGGSNVLVADEGVREVVILNQARGVWFDDADTDPRVKAESGASLGGLARRAVERGWAGLEWAATVPGTVGGAVVGNAGAHGGDVAGSLEAAEILQHPGRRERWPVERFEYAYRSSWLKRHPGQAAVLLASFHLQRSTRAQTRARMAGFVAQRRATQPAGASWGSMFKNPPGDYAGRLIEAAGLKGAQQGGVRVSPQHANFFINTGQGTAADAWALIQRARGEVAARFGVDLELEIERIGDWQEDASQAGQGLRGGN